MASRIRLLPEVVANQIAAGEVVEEPASVVKEMMENAIDAGAGCVKLIVRNGGADLIQIVDDGCGMSAIDARLAFDRHATSKIASVEDIYALKTFGFRGEALASIAAVSQVELRTRLAEDEFGTETLISGGEFISQKPVMTPVGSNFQVKNLFYNVPARRKFLREPSKLAANVKAEFQRVALCYPDIAFELTMSGNQIYNLRRATLLSRIVEVVGGIKIKQNLLEINADTSIVKLKGYVGTPELSKKRNSEQYLFVNGRYFKSPYLNKAVVKAYEKLIPNNHFPSYFIYMTIDPDRIDVNVSPKKTEIKFADMDAVWQIVNAAVRETLAKTGIVPMMDFDNESNIEIPLSRGIVYEEPRSAVDETYNPFLIPDDDDGNGATPAARTYPSAMSGSRQHSANSSYGLAPNSEFGINGPNIYNEEFDEFISGSGSPISGSLLQDIPAEKPSFASAVYLGGGYASAMFNNRLTLIDLRRAKERILYENRLMLLNSTSSVSQQLLFPERLTVSNDEYSILEENAAEFETLGFDLDFEGNCTIAVKGVPIEAGDDNIDELLYELIKVFETPVSIADLKREKIAAAMARSGASHAPKNVSEEELQALLDQLLQSGNIRFSPSGKAILAEITTDDIRNKLG